jgi:hypothetical protein
MPRKFAENSPVLSGSITRYWTAPNHSDGFSTSPPNITDPQLVIVQNLVIPAMMQLRWGVAWI